MSSVAKRYGRIWWLSAISLAIVDVEIINATNGQSNGQATIIANPLNIEYSLDGISWQTSPVFTGLAIGTHTAMIRDENGCIDEMEFIIGNDILNNVEVTAETVEYCMNLPVVVPLESENFIDIVEFTVVIQFDPDGTLFHWHSECASRAGRRYFQLQCKQ